MTDTPRIHLKDYQQAAYDRALELMAGPRHRAAVVMPTGCGKGWVAMHYAMEHPQEQVLWLGPSWRIQRQLEASVAKALGPGWAPPANVAFLTYPKLLAMAKEGELPYGDFGCVILDELHRTLAPQWGQAVDMALEAFPEAKVLGLTATPERPFDVNDDGTVGRDAVEARFGSDVALDMGLPEAFGRGILTFPRYVVGLYEVPEAELKGLDLRIGALWESRERAAARDQYEGLRRLLHDCLGVDGLLAKHLPEVSADPKVAVFCPDRARLEAAMAQAGRWMAWYPGEVRLYRCVTGDEGADAQLRAFADDSAPGAKMLFCIDMLNEGVHVGDIDAEVMVRPTASPTVYKQQLGRVLECGSNAERLVLDLVNNFQSATEPGDLFASMGGARGAYDVNALEGEALAPESEYAWRVHDETLGAAELFQWLDGRVRELEGAAELEPLVAEREAMGAAIPRKRAAKERRAYLDVTLRNAMRAHRLAPSQEERLEACGMRMPGPLIFALGKTVDKTPAAPLWHPTKNGDAGPENFRADSETEVWWMEDGREWREPVRCVVDRMEGRVKGR